MKITFDEVLNNNDWLHSCLLSSLTGEAIDSGIETSSYEVMLSVNGILIEPKHLNTLLDGIEDHIKDEAKALVTKKLTEAKTKAQLLVNLIDEAAANIQYEMQMTLPTDYED